MEFKTRILEHLTDKVAGEANEEKLQELHRLLENNAGMHQQVKLISEWLQDGTKDDPEHAARLFEKIARRISNVTPANGHNCKK